MSGSREMMVAEAREDLKTPTLVIPPYMIAEAMSSLHGLDLRWSSPITPTEMQYVEQYVRARYPEFYESESKAANLPVVKEDQEYTNMDSGSKSSPLDGIKRRSPGVASSHREWGVKKMPLEASRLQDILNAQKPTSTSSSSSSSSLSSSSSSSCTSDAYNDNALSVPELHARNTLLKHLGVTDNDYLVVFTASVKDAMMLVGESYPFFRYTYYMTVLDEDMDMIREFASFKEAKIILALTNWLDLRIAGSQLSQSFRKKTKQSPKGLFAYPADIRGTRNSLHWVSEAQRNSWHVLLDASALNLCDEQLNLTLHKPDYVICTLSRVVGHSTMTCLLVRKSSFA